MSLMTTWTTTHVPTRRDVPAQRSPRSARADWQCANCSRPNPGVRKRCTDCGTSRF